MAVWLALACGASPAQDPCADPGTWEDLGAPFVDAWCVGCHDAQLVGADRLGAPADVDLGALADVRAHADRVEARAVDEATMPPSGGPSPADREAFGRWLACGAPGDEAPVDAGCGRVGAWTLTGATCNGADFTDAWTQAFPSTSLVVTDDGGTCAIEYVVADAGCEERQAWRSTLEPPRPDFAFLGTVACAPAGCALAARPDDPCAVVSTSITLPVPVADLPNGDLAIGPLAPPELAQVCGALGLVFARVSP